MSDVRPIRDARLGTVLRGTYHLDQLLGRGATGTVYLATDIRDGSVCAVKLLRAVPGALLQVDTAQRTGADGTPEEQRNARRFAREARIIAGLSHPNIVKIYAFERGEDDSESFIAMELLTGETLGKRLLRGPLSPREALALYEPLCSAVGYAHDHGVIHRDLKPDNVFLVGSDLNNPRVLDFGISKITDPGASQLTDDSILGTPAYMAPELARAPSQADPRVDVFALGAMLFHLLTGRLPFEGETMLTVLRKLLSEDPPPLRRYRPDLSEALDRAVLRAMARDPGQRYQTPDDLVWALKAGVMRLDGAPVDAAPSGATAPVPPSLIELIEENADSASTPVTADPVAATWAAAPTSLLQQISVPASVGASASAGAGGEPVAHAHTHVGEGGALARLRERWPAQWLLGVAVGGVLGVLIALAGLLGGK